MAPNPSQIRQLFPSPRIQHQDQQEPRGGENQQLQGDEQARHDLARREYLQNLQEQQRHLLQERQQLDQQQHDLELQQQQHYGGADVEVLPMDPPHGADIEIINVVLGPNEEQEVRVWEMIAGNHGNEHQVVIIWKEWV